MPFCMLDSKEKNECSKYLSAVYLQHIVLNSEPAMDENGLQILRLDG